MTAGYFETFAAKLKSGREFTAGDTAASRPVAIINESFARTHFPNMDPLGRQMMRSRPGSKEPWLTIVGVVPDLIMEGIGNNNASPAGYYIPIAQSDVANGVRIAVRTRAEPAAVTSLVRSAVGSLDGDLAIFDVRARDCRCKEGEIGEVEQDDDRQQTETAAVIPPAPEPEAEFERECRQGVF